MKEPKYQKGAELYKRKTIIDNVLYCNKTRTNDFTRSGAKKISKTRTDHELSYNKTRPIYQKEPSRMKVKQ